LGYIYIQKRKKDIIFKIIDNLSTRAYKFLKKSKVNTNMTHIELIGCKPQALKQYLENKFTDGMSYDNYGEWEVDHIKAITRYDLNDIKQVNECFHYTNLQPLWRLDNIRKSNKI